MKKNSKRLQQIMRELNVDCLIASAPENVFYISDVPCSFTASNRLLFCSRRTSPLICILSREGDPTMISSAAALDVVVKHTWIKDLRLYATGTYIFRRHHPNLSGNTCVDVLMGVLSERLGTGNGKRLALELNDISAMNFNLITRRFRSNHLIDASDLLMRSRMIKNTEEIRRFKKANQILCKGFDKVEDACKDRPSEVDLDILLKTELMKNGAESWQQTTIAAGRKSGPDIYNQPVPERRIKPGDVIRIDVGCVYKGYTADLSRTFFVDKCSLRAKKTYDALYKAFMGNLDSLAPGIQSCEINKSVVDYVKNNLDPSYYRGNVGHGVGVELYDRPTLSIDDTTPLEAGMTMSYEVPYHISGLGGFNIEDSILITKRGKEIVSRYDRGMIEV